MSEAYFMIDKIQESMMGARAVEDWEEFDRLREKLNAIVEKMTPRPAVPLVYAIDF